MATWVETVRAMANWYSNNIHSYQSRGDTTGAVEQGAVGSSGHVLYFPCPVIPGNKLVLNDCCGFVGSCLTAFGVPGLGNAKKNKAAGIYGPAAYINNETLAQILTSAGFQRLSFDSNNLIEGDIYASSGHVEIFARYNGNSQWLTYTWGNIHDGISGTKLPSPSGWRKGATTGYQVLWRYTGNGNATLGSGGGFGGFGGGFSADTTFICPTPREYQDDHILMLEAINVKTNLLKEILESAEIICDVNTNSDIDIKNKYSFSDLFVYKPSDSINKNLQDPDIKYCVTHKFKHLNVNATNKLIGKYRIGENVNNIKYVDDLSISECIAKNAVALGLIQLGGLGNINIDFGAHTEMASQYSEITGISLYDKLSKKHEVEFLQFLIAMINDGAPALAVGVFAGCSMQECAGNIHVINKPEYDGNGASGTSGWNAGESSAGFTHWSSKEKLIKQYNAKSGISKRLPTTWEAYSQGKPKIDTGGHYEFSDNGNHICDLNASDMGKFTNVLYLPVFNSAISTHGSNIALLCAEFFLRKSGYDKHTGDRLADAYYAGEVYKKHNKKPYNSFLAALKYTELFLGTHGGSLGLSLGGPADAAGGLGGEILMNGNTGGSAFLQGLFGRPVPTNTGTAGIQSGQHLPMPAWMAQQMTTINIFGKSHQVHYKAAPNFVAVYNDIMRLNLPYTIKSSGTLSFRVVNNGRQSNNMSLSNHSYGLAIDINVSSNPFVKGAAAPRSGKPTNGPEMRSFDHPVVQAFLRHGFGWGGAYGDYMHFSIPAGH